MKITRITATAGMTVPHPFLEYANIRREITVEAELQGSDHERPGTCAQLLDMRAQTFCSEAITKAREALQAERQAERESYTHEQRQQRISELRARAADAAERITRLEAGEPDDDITF